ncbi:hypothetical protein AgCh_017106 [Apium graveolens]
MLNKTPTETKAKGAAAFLNEVYLNPICTYFSDQARPLQLSWAPGPGCTSDWNIGDFPGFSAWYLVHRVHDIYIQLYPGDRVEARPHPVCFFHDMLWSRVSSSGLLALEDVMSIPDICNIPPRLSFFDKRKQKTNLFGDFCGCPH